MAALPLRPTPGRSRRESAATGFERGQVQGVRLHDVGKSVQDAHEEQAGGREEILRPGASGCRPALEVLSIHGAANRQASHRCGSKTGDQHRSVIQKSNEIKLWISPQNISARSEEHTSELQSL